MSAAIERATSTLSALDSAAKDFISKRSAASASLAQSDSDAAARNDAAKTLDSRKQDVDAAIEALKAERDGIVESTK